MIERSLVSDSAEKHMNKLRVIAVLTIVLSLSPAQAGNNMKAFPPPDTGMGRYVLHLPQQDEEADLKVELIVGKTVAVDERNQYFFGGKIEEETIKGWGYPRYTVSDLGPMAGTLMAVDPNAPKVNRFIALSGDPFLIRYNSRLPVVVYAPEGVEVRYRIWRAEPETKPIEEG